MSVSALTTAMAVAAAAVPAGEAPALAAPSGSESVEVDHERAEVGPVAGPEVPLPLILAQIAAQPLSEAPDPLTKPVQSTDTAQSVEPGSSQAESQPQAPVAGQKDIVVTGRRPTPEDPLVELNAQSFKVAQSVDKSVVAPVAFAYGEIFPRPIRKGLNNFLHNLGEPIVFLNFLLQLKFDKAAETLGRFAINTALGAGGLVDIAKRKPFNLPRRENGFANTLGFYGVKAGPYFFLPLVGPTTLRDFIGGRLDLLLLPTALPKLFRKPEVVVPVWILKELGRRIEFEDELSEFRATRDPYVAARTHYLQKRQAEIDALHGRKATKPAERAPASEKPPPNPIAPAPVPDAPQSQIPTDRSGASGLGDTGDFFGGLSILGTGSFPRRFINIPLVNFRVDADQ